MQIRSICVIVALGLVGLATAQPFLPGQPTVVPLGNLRTNDGGGPYNLTLLPVQANEVKGAIAARKNYTDQDIINFLTNVECLEGLFDTWGVFGRGFNGNLSLGGPTPIGARAALLTDRTRPYLEEVALNEQGHALFTRHAGSRLPCPPIDFINGFNSLMAYAYNLTVASNSSANETIAAKFGAAFDPFLNDQCFVLSVLTLEEVGARGNKGLTGLLSNPVLANSVAGLATSATAQATSERRLLWDLRDELIFPFNETAQQVFARISAARDDLDGPQIDDQGLINTDPRFIAVPGLVNLIPTDIQGLTFSMTPQQAIRIVTVAAPNAKGGFFPEGLYGAINSWEGYNVTDPNGGVGDFPGNCTDNSTATAANVSAVGTIGPLIPGPNVTDELALTQSLDGPLDNGTYLTRGYYQYGEMPYFNDTPMVSIADNGHNGAPTSTMSAAGRKLFKLFF